MFRIRIRVPKGKKAVSAVVRVNGKKVKVVRGKRLRAAVRLRGLPKGRFSVRITVRLANGKRITGVRRYHTCIPSSRATGRRRCSETGGGHSPRARGAGRERGTRPRGR